MSKAASVLFLAIAFFCFSLAHVISASQMLGVVLMFGLAGASMLTSILLWAHHCFTQVARKPRRR